MHYATMAGAALAFVAALLLTGEPAHGQDERRAYAPEAVQLARLCWNEAEHRYSGDCSAIHASIENKAALRGISWEAMARAYAPRTLGHRIHERTHRRFIPFLRGDLGRPRHWPGGWRGSWTEARERWARRLEQARRIWAGEERHRCDEEPTDWGGPSIDRTLIARKVRNGVMRRVDCGPTLNVFLRLTRADGTT